MHEGAQLEKGFESWAGFDTPALAWPPQDQADLGFGTSTVCLLPSAPRHATGHTKMMDPYRGRELKTKGLHWKRMKGLEAV
jgi:hypothetical protein